MDPLTITCSAIGLATGVIQTIMRISVFVSEVRGARKDMDAVTRELMSLQLCLETLRDDDQQRHIVYPQDMTRSIHTILVNIELTLDELRKLLSRLFSGRMGRRIQWALTEQDEVNKLRSSLESNKLALEVALTVGTITLLTTQKRSIAAQAADISVLMQQTSSIAVTTSQIEDHVSILPAIQKDTSKIDVIASELITLRNQMVELAKQANGKQSWKVFVDQSRSCALSIVEPHQKFKEAVNVLESTKAFTQAAGDPSFRDSAVSLTDAQNPVCSPGMKLSDATSICSKCSRSCTSTDDMNTTSSSDDQAQDTEDEYKEQLLLQQSQIARLTHELGEAEKRIQSLSVSSEEALTNLQSKFDVASMKRDAALSVRQQVMTRLYDEIQESDSKYAALKAELADEKNRSRDLRGMVTRYEQMIEIKDTQLTDMRRLASTKPERSRHSSLTVNEYKPRIASADDRLPVDMPLSSLQVIQQPRRVTSNSGDLRSSVMREIPERLGHDLETFVGYAATNSRRRSGAPNVYHDDIVSAKSPVRSPKTFEEMGMPAVDAGVEERGRNYTIFRGKGF